jgi:Rho-binding antiterminator
MGVGEGTYRPIDCGLHDRLEALATLRRPCRVVFHAEDGAHREVQDRIVDVFARAGAEFVRLASGTEVRLDRLRSVDGVPFDGKHLECEP